MKALIVILAGGITGCVNGNEPDACTNLCMKLRTTGTEVNFILENGGSASIKLPAFKGLDSPDYHIGIVSNDNGDVELGPQSEVGLVPHIRRIVTLHPKESVSFQIPQSVFQEIYDIQQGCHILQPTFHWRPSSVFSGLKVVSQKSKVCF